MKNSILKYLGWNDQLSTVLESQFDKECTERERYIYLFIRINTNAPLKAEYKPVLYGLYKFAKIRRRIFSARSDF